MRFSRFLRILDKFENLYQLLAKIPEFFRFGSFLEFQWKFKEIVKIFEIFKIL